MYKKKLLFLVVFLLLNTYYLIHTTRVSAQDFSLGVYPPILQITTTPPTSIKQNVTLVNQSDSPVSLSVSFRPFTQSTAENGQVQYLSPNDVFGSDPDIFKKMQLLDNNTPLSVIELAPKQQKTFTLHIGLPKNEPPGDYYFSIIFSSNPNATVQNGSDFSGAIATNVLLSIGPYDKTSGILEEYSAPWFATNGPIPFTVKVTNLSRHFIAPRGEILIRNMFGQLIGKVDLLPVNILEGTSRFIPGAVAANQPATNNTATTAVWPEKFLLGMYRANIIISLAPEGPIYTRTLYFFAMPWQYMLGIGITLSLVAFIIYRVKQYLK